MKIDGACHCGYITYEAEIDPADTIICHCTDCQIISGAPFRTIVFADSTSFRLKSGELKVYVKTAQSGNKRAQKFCPECGTHVYASNVGDGPMTLGLRVGAIRQRGLLKPESQHWCQSAMDWVVNLKDIDRAETPT